MDVKFIAERITELRLKKNVSEYQMSLDLGKNKSYLQNISSGRSLPSMSQFLEICNYFNITPQQFFDEGLHNLPLYQKANDLLKQLDDDDMMAVIAILNRLTAKNKRVISCPQGQLFSNNFQSAEIPLYYSDEGARLPLHIDNCIPLPED